MLAAHQWLAVAYVMIADSIDGMVDRQRVLNLLDEQLARPALPDRATWGTDPTAAAAQRAMMKAAGGPAPMRSPDAKRPAAWSNREVSPASDDHR